MQQIILGKHLKIGDVIPGSTPEYNRTVIEFDYKPWVSKKIHRTTRDTYRIVYFKEQNRLPMTVFDNSPITISYKKYRRNNKIGL